MVKATICENNNNNNSKNSNGIDMKVVISRPERLVSLLLSYSFIILIYEYLLGVHHVVGGFQVVADFALWSVQFKFTFAMFCLGYCLSCRFSRNRFLSFVFILCVSNMPCHFANYIMYIVDLP